MARGQYNPTGDGGDQELQKIFSDPIHGPMEFGPLIVKIINTKEFQRLKDIKQLGVAYYVYPAASHNRFEHSLGVCHLAGILALQLKKSQKELKITDDDVLCVELAGLCHDLGHGPFSHLYDDTFLKEHYLNQQGETNQKLAARLTVEFDGAKMTVTQFAFLTNTEMNSPGVDSEKARKKMELLRHEKRSCEMLDYLLKKNELTNELTPAQLCFIKYMIDPADDEKAAKTALGEYYDTFKDKLFLAEIVSNKRNGVDVDKFDYLARDCYMTGLKSSFDHRRFMKFVKVLPDEKGEMQLCARDKELEDLYVMFHARTHLHSRMCSHPVTKVLEVMMSDALLAAEKDGALKWRGSDGRDYCLSNGYEDMGAFTQMTDSVFYKVLESDSKKAIAILERILRRDLYKRVGEPFQLQKDTHSSSKMDEYAGDVKYARKAKREIIQLLKKMDNNNILQSDIKLKMFWIRYGQAKNKETASFKFYTKEKQNECKAISPEKTLLFTPQQTELVCLIMMFKREVGPNDSRTQALLDGLQEAFTSWKQMQENKQQEEDGEEKEPITYAFNIQLG